LEHHPQRQPDPEFGADPRNQLDRRERVPPQAEEVVGTADSLHAQDFGKKPLLKLPQQFYRGTTKIILDLSFRPEVKFLRAKSELNRWGRVAPTPMFVASLDLEEIPPMSRDTPTKRAVISPR